ncbi:MAG: glycosyltransferase [bacterium]
MPESWIPLAQLDTNLLRENLAYVRAHHPELAQALAGAANGEPLLFLPRDGYILCRTASSAPQWIFGAAGSRPELLQIRQDIQNLPPGAQLVILAGSAIGYALAPLLPALLDHPTRHILVVEPSAARVQACLAFLDVRAAMNTGRLHFSIQSGSADGILAAIQELNLWGLNPLAVYRPPHSRLNLDPGELDARYQKMSAEKAGRREEILLSLSQKPETADRPVIQRVLFLDCWPGAPGSMHAQAIGRELRALGIESRVLPLNRYRIEAEGRAYRRRYEPQLLALLDAFAPDLIVSYGYHAPVLVERDLYDRVPARWLQVVTTVAYFDTAGYFPGEHTGLIDRHLIPIYQRRGAPHPFYLPLMANYVAEQPPIPDRRFPVVFVGNSFGLPAAETAHFHNRWQGRPRLQQYIAQAEHDLSRFDPAVHLYNFLEAQPIPEVSTPEEEYAVFRYLYCQGTAARRRRLLERIAPYGLHIFGGDWRNYLPPDSPLLATLHGYIPIHEEVKIFQYGHIFVNLHTIGHVTGPNMRFFNVPGMGGFQISDVIGFSTFLEPDTETVYYTSEDEFAERVRYYREHPAEADEIRLRGYERVKKDWTYQTWIAQVFQELGLRAPGEASAGHESPSS